VHILIATDGSRPSLDAVQTAVGLLASAKRVTLLTVLSQLPVEDYDEYDETTDSLETQSRYWDSAISEANRELERAASVVVAANVDQRVEAGDIAPTICSVATEIGADVIVIGPHMHGRFRPRFRTSIAERVVRDAPCAVLVAHETGVPDGA
jgi:nucleotide-binding universal stress UspA family protein